MGRLLRPIPRGLRRCLGRRISRGRLLRNVCLLRLLGNLLVRRRCVSRMPLKILWGLLWPSQDDISRIGYSGAHIHHEIAILLWLFDISADIYF